LRVRKAVIPAAGLGTRLLPLTRSLPKEMLPVGRKPVIQYVIEEIHSAGIEYILIITSQSKRLIEDYFDGSKSLPGEVFYVNQAIRPDLPYGLAYAVSLAEGFVGNEPFLVCLGDCIIKTGDANSLLRRLIHTHETHNSAATVAFEEVSPEQVSRYGIAKPRDGIADQVFPEEFRLDDIVEKPSRERAPSNLAVAARYVLEPEIFSYIKQTQRGAGGELQLTDSIRLLLKNGRPVWGVRLKNEVRYDIGGFAGYFKAFFEFSLADEDFGEKFRQYMRQRLLQ
jgi:UTP--glucose-1-phosphate uridylyltransferase